MKRISHFRANSALNGTYAAAGEALPLDSQPGSECNRLISTASLARLTRLKTLWFHLEVGETNFNHPEYDFSVLIT
jgi:hypothetical protein